MCSQSQVAGFLFSGDIPCRGTRIRRDGFLSFSETGRIQPVVPCVFFRMLTSG